MTFLENIFKEVKPRITGVIHIGGFIGTEYNFYKEYGINKIVFFEPHPKAFAKLYYRLHDKEDVVLINKALGNFTGKTQMYAASNIMSSSLLKPALHKIYYSLVEFGEIIEVDIDRLDNYDFPYNFINIDVQGYELEVFKGATKTLSQVDYIYTEINIAELYEGCVKLNELDYFLKEYGFERTHIEKEREEMIFGWCDAFYQRI